MKMKIRVEAHEHYPIYHTTEFSDLVDEIELTEEELKDFRRVHGEFWDWQRKIQEKIDGR